MSKLTGYLEVMEASNGVWLCWSPRSRNKSLRHWQKLDTKWNNDIERYRREMTDRAKSMGVLLEIQTVSR